ncbi:MAG: hypothetical protein ACR2Q4_07870 [Geminicoccaceae bacterium]
MRLILVFCLAICVASVMLVGCQRPPVIYDVPTSRSYDSNPSVLWPEIVGFLTDNGLTLTEADPNSGRITAQLIDFEPREWSACRRARVVDNENRRDRGRPVNRQMALEIDVTSAEGGSVVRPRAKFTERQINPFRNLPFFVACPSTGLFERTLLAALQN